MPEYVFRGRVTLSGASFYISAPTREAAIEAAKVGAFDDCDYDAAEILDCAINERSIEENS